MTTRLYCSFCGKRSDEVLVLVAGPTTLICDECTDACAFIVAEYRARSAMQAADLGPDGERYRLKPPRCPHCDDTGDVHRIDGEWLGRCNCGASPSPL